MGRVTDVIIHAADEWPIWYQINEWRESRGWSRLVFVMGSGGNKAPQMTLARSAINYFDDKQAFAAFVASLPWENPEQVVLLMTTEEDPTQVFTLRLRPLSTLAQNR